MLGAALYVPGLNWGQPALVSWSQDSIAGPRTLGAMETWPHHWMGRYPPLHYMVLAGAYQPVLQHWREIGEMTIDPQSGKQRWSPPHAPKVGLLLLIAGAVSAAMGIGTGLVLFFAVLRTTGGNAAASLLAATAFMSGAAFTYFAHLGNVDVPSVFWFSISLLFYVRLWESNGEPSVESGPSEFVSPRRPFLDAVWLGCFAALTVCTKDGWIAMYPGMAVALLLDRWNDAHKRGRTPAAALRSALLQPRWLAGLASFAVVFLLINAIPWNATAYTDRLRGWLSPTAQDWVSHETRLDSLSLAMETIRQAACAVGWPMLCALLVSAIWVMVRRARLALLLFLPIVIYYLIVIERVDFVYERFLFAPLMLLCVAGGLACTAMLHSPRLASGFKFGVIMVIFVPTLAYAWSVNLEMVHDSRYAAEDWFRKHAPADAAIGALTDDLQRFSPQYLPRLHEQGFATYPVLCRVEEFDRPQPEFLVLSSFDHQDFGTAGRDCAKELMDGLHGYKPVAVLRPAYLGTARSWLGLAGWMAPAPGKISPQVTIFQADPDRRRN